MAKEGREGKEKKRDRDRETDSRPNKCPLRARIPAYAFVSVVVVFDLLAHQ